MRTVIALIRATVVIRAARLSRRSKSWLAVLLGIAALASACSKSGELRSALELQRSDWNRRVSALQARVGNLEARLHALPAASSGGAGATQVQRGRLQASVTGARQTLIDIQSHAADGARDVESAIRKGDGEGQEALSGLAARMNEFIGQQEQALAVNEDAITRVGEDVRP
jgi:hypothetical protein